MIVAAYPTRQLLNKNRVCSHPSQPLSPLGSFVQIKRRKQVFAFLLDGNSTIADVKTKISDVAGQHDIPEASEDSMLLLEGKPTEDDATLASMAGDGNKGAASEGLAFDLVYALADDEYEPVEIEPTRATA